MKLSNKMRHHWPVLILMVVSGVLAVGGAGVLLAAGPEVLHEMIRQQGVQAIFEAGLALGITAAVTLVCGAYLRGRISAGGLFGVVIGLLTYEYAVTVIWMVVAREHWSRQRMEEFLVDLIPAWLAWKQLRLERSRPEEGVG